MIFLFHKKKLWIFSREKTPQDPLRPLLPRKQPLLEETTPKKEETAPIKFPRVPCFLGAWGNVPLSSPSPRSARELRNSTPRWGGANKFFPPWRHPLKKVNNALIKRENGPRVIPTLRNPQSAYVHISKRHLLHLDIIQKEFHVTLPRHVEVMWHHIKQALASRKNVLSLPSHFSNNHPHLVFGTRHCPSNMVKAYLGASWVHLST